ncbi:MAG: type I secretion C-terminal target domain-containing protein [Alphaproteobacteria bacterium]|nr:type I secretion C-terminal target domain-containing protein [Alphaproteobacteria bacterium]
MSDNEVRIGDVVFVVDPNNQASAEDRQNAIDALEQFARMGEFDDMFSGSGMDHGLTDNKVNVYVGTTPVTGGGAGQLGTFLDSDGLYKVGTADIYIDPAAVDESRYFSPEDGQWHEETVEAVLANELGNLAAALNKDLDIEATPGANAGNSGNNNTTFGYPYGADANGDPLPPPPPSQTTPTPGSWADQNGSLEKYSAQVEDLIHDLFGEPKRVQEGPGSYDSGSGSVGNDPGNVSIWKTAQEWFDLGMSNRSQAERNFMDDVLSQTGYDWQNDALNDALLDYAWGHLDFVWDVGTTLVIAAALAPISPWAALAAVAFWAAWNNGSPLVLDLDGDGVELVSLVNSNVYWDIDQDGFAEAVGWVQADDGFLAIDANSDGIITDHSELFGSVAEDGFTDLRLLDSNSDNVINASDTSFGQLLVWRDLNQNGYSEENELFTLAELDIVSINLNATVVNQTNQGHDISHVSTYTVDDGVSGPQNLAIVDVWFQYDDINSSFVGDYTLDLASLFTVNQRGYGTLPDLYIAASEDNDLDDPESLLSLLTAFSGKMLDELFVDDGSVLAEVQAIMFRWAGVDGVDPASRGAHLDARKLEFLEELFGQEFLQQGFLEDPGGLAANLLDVAFDIALNGISARLIAQGAGLSLFAGGAFYNPVTDGFEGITGFNQAALDALLAKSLDPNAVTDKTAFWMQVVNVVDQAVGVTNLSSGDLQLLEDTLTASDFTLSVDQLLERIQWALDIHLGTAYTGNTLQGTTGNDTLVADASNDTLLGGNGNDDLSGGLGDDILSGGNGADILFGGLGNDRLDGDGGADLYKFYAGHGDDILWESGTDIDTLEFGPGVTLADLEIIRISNTALRIGILPSAGTGSITVEFGNLEILKFADASTFDLRTMDQTLIGTSGNDTLRGMLAGSMGTGSDTIYGMDGNDILYADAGNESDVKVNWLYGGNGNDSLYGDGGNDELYGEADNDTLTGYGGHDTLAGGTGDDTATGGAGDDRYLFNYGDGNDTFLDTGGADRIVFGAGITAASLNVFRISNDNVKIEIDGGTGGSIVISGQTIGNIIETLEFADSSTVTLTSYDLTLNGTSAGETLYGVNVGGSGVDTIYGHGGNDIIYGYRGTTNAQANFLYAGDGDDQVHGGSGVDTIEGNVGNDTLRGYNGSDTIDGGDGNDLIYGGSQDDILIGGAGNDQLFGDNDNDILIGGLGADELTGGNGSDIFRFVEGEAFDAVDTIKDFNTTYDSIDVADLLEGFDPLTDAITDFVQITTSGSDSLVAVDADGGGDNFIQIAVILNKTGLTDEAALVASGRLIAA